MKMASGSKPFIVEKSEACRSSAEVSPARGRTLVARGRFVAREASGYIRERTGHARPGSGARLALRPAQCGRGGRRLPAHAPRVGSWVPTAATATRCQRHQQGSTSRVAPGRLRWLKTGSWMLGLFTSTVDATSGPLISKCKMSLQCNYTCIA